ncbi:hypothetical protein PS2_270 [Serratia phage PS2]|uniref:Uncharacterized protein n=1 Tax=Serratia phage PS2 TaxID=1481112 RepID=A0A023W627_9CAUD|nr:hypothetical protein FF83_gp145 [Serratia phage PS2]AHY25508.1 hypothetical protein PS2_270 [Serratia phage PS2]
MFAFIHKETKKPLRFSYTTIESELGTDNVHTLEEGWGDALYTNSREKLEAILVRFKSKTKIEWYEANYDNPEINGINFDNYEIKEVIFA